MCERTAAELTLRPFLNCVVREYAGFVSWENDEGKQKLILKLSSAYDRLVLPVLYRSVTGHHLFGSPITLVANTDKKTIINETDAVTIIVQCLMCDASDEGRHDLLNRIHASHLTIRDALERRVHDLDTLIGEEVSFIAAEQGLIAGHDIHPCPKSFTGMNREEIHHYSPEFAASFPLRWFAIDREFFYIRHSDGSSSAQTWLNMINNEILPSKHLMLPGDNFCLLPIHPWQAIFVLNNHKIATLVAAGKIFDCGEIGYPWFPTSSVRTLYRPDLPFMLKLSLNVGITNSVRINKTRELLRGNDMYRFCHHHLWHEFVADYPEFTLIPDPGCMGVVSGGKIIEELSVSVRENPFVSTRSHSNITLLAALCEHIPRRGSRLGALIRRSSDAEKRSVQVVAREWFSRFLSVFVRPVFALYLRHGVAVEAHQQNILIEIVNGYPTAAFYRDNQGFFHHSRAHAELSRFLPGLGEASESVFDEDIVDERFTYYTLVNSIFGIIGALGRENFITEEELIVMLRDNFLSLKSQEGGSSQLIDKILTRKLQCKANLRTRLAQMDELIGSPENQSVYLEINNPLILTQRDSDL